VNKLAQIHKISFAKWRHFITARQSDCGYPRAVLSLKQSLAILWSLRSFFM